MILTKDSTNVERFEYTLQGVYAKKSKTLYNKGLKGVKGVQKLLICNRNTRTKTKALQFIIDISSPERTYISSLYPTKEKDIFEIEYAGVRYVVNMTKPTIVTILPKRWK